MSFRLFPPPAAHRPLLPTEQIDPEYKSFVSIVPHWIPNVGFETFMAEATPDKDMNGTLGVKLRHELNLDGGEKVMQYVISLLQGKLEGKTVL